MADETAVVDAGAVTETTAAVETPAVATETPATGTETPVTPAPVDPNDPMVALQAAMDAQLGTDTPADPNAAPPEGTTPEIPEAFQQALTISEFVTTPESVQQAVRAADEVWQVATGKLPARAMLEGFKNSNPQQYQAIVNDLKDYLGVQAPQNGPLDALKTANPQAYEQLSQWYQQVMGKALDGPPDPREARLADIEKRFAAEEEARQTAVWNQQVESARSKAVEFIQAKTKGTAFEGLDSTLLALAGNKVGIPQEQMVQALLSGKTDKLEAAYKAVTAELSGLVKKINANMIKQHRTLANGVPAVKGANGVKPTGDAMKPLPGETTAQSVARILKG